MFAFAFDRRFVFFVFICVCGGGYDDVVVFRGSKRRFRSRFVCVCDDGDFMMGVEWMGEDVYRGTYICMSCVVMCACLSLIFLYNTMLPLLSVHGFLLWAC